MYIDLDIIKKHLNISPTYTKDDDYLEIIEDGATKAVEKTINVDFDEIIAAEGKLPSAILFACLLIIGDMYANRETTAFASVNKLPTLRYLCANYTDYQTVKED
jgi:hypothetical protein